MGGPGHCRIFLQVAFGLADRFDDEDESFSCIVLIVLQMALLVAVF
jgi:hypothetical protein